MKKKTCYYKKKHDQKNRKYLQNIKKTAKKIEKIQTEKNTSLQKKV
jgi:hypothetical protein